MKPILALLLTLLACGCRAPRQDSVTIRFSGDTEHGVTEIEVIPPK